MLDVSLNLIANRDCGRWLYLITKSLGKLHPKVSTEKKKENRDDYSLHIVKDVSWLLVPAHLPTDLIQQVNWSLPTSSNLKFSSHSNPPQAISVFKGLLFHSSTPCLSGSSFLAIKYLSFRVKLLQAFITTCRNLSEFQSTQRCLGYHIF